MGRGFPCHRNVVRKPPPRQSTKTNETRMHLDSDPLLIVDDTSPSKLEIVVLNANEAAGLEER